MSCMLDSRAEMNLVRLQRLYLNKKLQTNVGIVKLYLSGTDGKIFELQDTLITGMEKYLFYKIPRSYLKKGNYYRLVLQADSIKERTAECNYFNDPGLRNNSYLTVGDGALKFETMLYFTKNLDCAFMHRYFVDYEVLEDGVYKRKLAEVPLSVSPALFYKSFGPDALLPEQVEGPKAFLATTETASDFNNSFFYEEGNYYCSIYEGNAMQVILAGIGKNRKPETVRIKGTFVVFYQVDKSFFMRFIYTQNERFSVRLDEQLNQSNVYEDKIIKYGLFGAITTDTLRIKIDIFMFERFKYINAQN